MIADALAKALHGRKCGSGWIARCPAHDDRHPSLSIAEDNGTLLVHCFAGCSQESVLGSLKSMGLGDTGQPNDAPIRRSTRDVDTNQKVAAAKRIWAESVPATGTPAQTYLACRGILQRMREFSMKCQGSPI